MDRVTSESNHSAQTMNYTIKTGTSRFSPSSGTHRLPNKQRERERWRPGSWASTKPISKALVSLSLLLQAQAQANVLVAESTNESCKSDATPPTTPPTAANKSLHHSAHINTSRYRHHSSNRNSHSNNSTTKSVHHQRIRSNTTELN